MLGNTTRSATIVFRFLTQTLAKFLLKRHTRFAYVARIGPFRLNRATEGQTFCCTFSAGLHRTMAGSFRELQPPCRAGHCAPTLQGSWLRQMTISDQNCHSLQPGDGCHWAHPPMSKINLRHRSPPPHPDGEVKIHFARDSPSISWNDSISAVLCQCRARRNWLKNIRNRRPCVATFVASQSANSVCNILLGIHHSTTANI